MHTFLTYCVVGGLMATFASIRALMDHSQIQPLLKDLGLGPDDTSGFLGALMDALDVETGSTSDLQRLYHRYPQVNRAIASKIGQVLWDLKKQAV
jgi:hypothetical protein